jgi:hypothetical protein
MTRPAISEQDSQQPTQPETRKSRRWFIGAGAAALAGIVVDATVSPLDILGSQAHRQQSAEQERRNAESSRAGENQYTETFFASEPTMVKPGDKDVAIKNNPLLSQLRNLDYAVSQVGSVNALYFDYGIGLRELEQGLPARSILPPDLGYNIKSYGDKKPNYMVIAPGKSELVGLLTSPLPAGLLAIFDGDEKYAGDITLTMGDDRVNVTNHGLGEHRVHLLPLETVPEAE